MCFTILYTFIPNFISIREKVCIPLQTRSQRGTSPEAKSFTSSQENFQMLQRGEEGGGQLRLILPPKIWIPPPPNILLWLRLSTLHNSAKMGRIELPRNLLCIPIFKSLGLLVIQRLIYNFLFQRVTLIKMNEKQELFTRKCYANKTNF